MNRRNRHAWRPGKRAPKQPDKPRRAQFDPEVVAQRVEDASWRAWEARGFTRPRPIALGPSC